MSAGSHSPEFSPAQWARAKSILVRALSLPPAQRPEFLRNACSDDQALLEQVSSLLRAEAQAPPFLRRPETAMAELIASPMPPLVPPAPGQTIGSCRLLSLLGEGATGLVYLAEQARPRRLVAVKILRPGQSSPPALRRLEREAEIMARMRHPGIAQVVESGLSDSGPFVVMEYVEGEPVTHYSRKQSLGVADRLHLFLRICDAAQHAHSMGVIHRDLKPANILVTPSGQPKILDFGVARAADFDHRHTLSDSLGQLIGTLAYMSPEQAAGDIDAVDTRADVYALGCILHELLAGRPPLDILGKPLHEVLRIIQSDAPPRLGAISRACRGDLETIVAKALDKSREHRYSSVSELAGDVRRHLDRMPILARPPSTLYELRRFAQRRRPLVAGIGIAIAGLVGALAWSLVSRERAHQDFLIARSVAGSWLADVMKALETTPGTFDARRHMIEQLRGPLERFAERYPNDLEAQANLAGLRFATADLDAESGHYSAALDDYSDAFRVLTPIAGSRTAGVEWRLRQSVAAVRIGDILKDRGQLDDALGWYYAALAIDHAAAAEFPDNYTAQDQLIWSYDRLANISLDAGNVGDGRRFAELMESAATALLADCPENPKAMWCRIGAHRTTAHLLTVLGESNRAEEERLRALDIGRALVAIDPNRGYAIGQVVALAEHANTDVGEGDISAAQHLLLDEARPLVQRMLSLDRHDPIVRQAAFTYSTVLRRLQLARGDAAGARAAMNGVLDQARALARQDPGSIVAAMRVAAIECENAQMLAELGLVEDAVEAVCALRDELLRTSARFPGRPEPYTLLMRVAQAPPSPAPADAALALVAADRAAAFSSPPDPAPLIELAELLLQQDNPSEAAGVLQRAASLEGELAALRRPWLQSQVARLQETVKARR